MIRKIAFMVFGFSVAMAQIVSAETIDRILAKVGSEVITQSEYQLALIDQKTVFMQMHGMKRGAEEYEEFRKNALEEMILQKILVAEIKKEGTQVTEQEVDQEFQMKLRQMQVSDAVFAAQLAKQGVSLSSFKSNLKFEMEKQRFGSYEGL